MRAVFLLLLSTGLTFGQPQRFDQYTYQAPAGYSSQNDPGRVSWTRIDQARKFYCQILLFASQPSLGSAAADLAAEWKAVVDPSFHTRSEILRRDLPIPTAPESIVRVAETTNSKDKSRVLVSLYVLRFPGRYVGILHLVPHEQALEACQPDLAPLLPSVSLLAAPNTSAPSGPPPAPGSLLGVWELVQASTTPGRYNVITKQWEYDPVAALSQFRNSYKYTFQPNGQYLYEVELDSFNRYRRDRIREQGRYTINGGAIQLVPREHLKGGSDRRVETVLSPAPVPAPYTRRFLFGPHPQYGNLGLHLQDADGVWQTFAPPRP